jgi:predicted membrane metal-binding protein
MVKIKNKTIVLLIFLAVLLALAGGFFFYKYWQARQSDSQRQAKALLKYVGTIADVPAPETATIATVTDTSKLSNETLRARSQNGDKLLIYARAKRLILYRPSTKKIVETLAIETGAKADGTTEKIPRKL